MQFISLENLEHVVIGTCSAGKGMGGYEKVVKPPISYPPLICGRQDGLNECIDYYGDQYSKISINEWTFVLLNYK